MSHKREADICLFLEGSYPFVSGGVSSWTHDLITQQSHLTFHLVSLLPRDDEPVMKYKLPSNVISHTCLYLQRLEDGVKLSKKEATELFKNIEGALTAITIGRAGLAEFSTIIKAVMPYHERLGAGTLLDSQEAWHMLTNMYEKGFSETSFLDYFWSWRAVLAGLYSLISFPLPKARAYHAISTGFAGVLAARAKLETKCPVIVTEHGIYTNERRIEIASADWLMESASKTLTIDQTRIDLTDFWMNTFANYSHICYETSDHILTLFRGNQQAQIADGADPAKMKIIPNGIDVERFASIARIDNGIPTIALIGRVVPIKDIKSFIRAVAILRDRIPGLRALVIGPVDEDLYYVEECRKMADYFSLKDTLEFTGMVKIDSYLPEIDVVVFSSISEAQPLVVLEAGACGIPIVATDVGACREMILGDDYEQPALGHGGVIVPLSNPAALAGGVARLLTDHTFYLSCSQAIRQRVIQYYDKRDQHASYRSLYNSLIKV